jgi:endo-cleaving rubber dioxygenase
MTEVSRRGFLRSGGTAAALGGLGLVLPGRAWGWSPTGSVAGAGSTVDPATVFDSLADPVVAQLYRDNQWEQVNTLLTNWTTNDQAIPAGLPSYVTEFLETATQLPSWTNTALLDDFNDFFEVDGSYVGLLYGVGSGFLSTAIPNVARAVYYSQGGAQMKDRIGKTAMLGYDSVQPDAYTPSGAMIVTAVKTRMAHSAVRFLLPQSPYYPVGKTPISQADLLITWHSLATFTMGKLTAWGVPITQAQSDGFLHLWQITGHMLGTLDTYIPATWADAYTQKAELLDPVLGHTPEGVNLAEILINLVCAELADLPQPVVCAFIRYVLGDQIADYAQIPSYPLIEAGIAASWPGYVALQTSLQSTNIVPKEFFGAFDEILEVGVLSYFSDGEPLDITLPSGNRTNFTDQSGNEPWSPP